MRYCDRLVVHGDIGRNTLNKLLMRKEEITITYHQHSRHVTAKVFFIKFGIQLASFL